MQENKDERYLKDGFSRFNNFDFRSATLKHRITLYLIDSKRCHQNLIVFQQDDPRTPLLTAPSRSIIMLSIKAV